MAKKNLVEVPIDISDKTFLKIAIMAHEQDITFNQMCINILKEQILIEEKKFNKGR